MRILIKQLEECFDRLRAVQHRLIEQCPEEMLFTGVHSVEDFPRASVGEGVLRSAAAVEQVFGGLTTRLWDDPFEWTLPESLMTREKIFGYLAEVRLRQENGFRVLVSDADLEKIIPAPTEQTSIFRVLLDSLARAWYHLGKAESHLQVVLRDGPGPVNIAKSEDKS